MEMLKTILLAAALFVIGLIVTSIMILGILQMLSGFWS